MSEYPAVSDGSNVFQKKEPIGSKTLQRLDELVGYCIEGLRIRWGLKSLRSIKCPPIPRFSVIESCRNPGKPIDSSQPGSSVRGILQARILEWADTRLGEVS